MSDKAHGLLSNSAYQQHQNDERQQQYYQKLLAYYGGTFPMEYYRRVNRGMEGLRQLRKKWREREAAKMDMTMRILPDNVISLRIKRP